MTVTSGLPAPVIGEFATNGSNALRRLVRKSTLIGKKSPMKKMVPAGSIAPVIGTLPRSVV